MTQQAILEELRSLRGSFDDRASICARLGATGTKADRNSSALQGEGASRLSLDLTTRQAIFR
jgi:hypothetical protein